MFDHLQKRKNLKNRGVAQLVARCVRDLITDFETVILENGGMP